MSWDEDGSQVQTSSYPTVVRIRGKGLISIIDEVLHGSKVLFHGNIFDQSHALDVEKEAHQDLKYKN